MSIEIDIELKRLKALRDKVLHNPALAEAISHAWSTVYRAFTRMRYYNQSRGGGEWPALKPATLKRRRGGGQGAAILRDTGAMFAAMQPGLGSGGLMQTHPLKPLGFVAELSGGGTYDSGISLVEVASHHHHGRGNLPERKILVKPDLETIKQMADHGHRIVVKHMGER